MGNNLSYSDNYQKEAYKNYVFEKYHITEADFDSSMVWYTRHTEELAGLYKKVGERFRSEKKRMQELLALREDKPAASLPGDTVDVWYDRKLYWLTDVPLANKVTFEIPADSNFKARMLSCGRLIIYSFRKGNGEPLWGSIFCLIMILWWGV